MKKAGKAQQNNIPLSTLMLTDAGETEIPKKPEWWRSIPNGLRHPLALLLISSALIPFIIYLFNVRKASTESRQKKALEIVSKNADFEGQLYALYAELALFHRNNQHNPVLATSPADQKKELNSRKEGFAKQFAGHYAEFSKSYSDQHLWIDDLYVQGIILNLFSAEDVRKLKSISDGQQAELPAHLLKLREDIEKYKENFRQSLGLLGDFRYILLNDKYDPTNEDISTKIDGDYITGRYNKLRMERSLIIDELVRDFMP